MSKIASLPLKMESLAQCLKVCILPIPEEVVCSFFNILFDAFWAKYKFGLCNKTWKRGCGCLQSSFLPLKDSLALFQIGIFLLHYCLFRPILCYIENRVTKINFRYFNGNCHYSSCLGWSILFNSILLHAPSAHIIKSLGFLKKLFFELVYLCILIWF